MAVALRMTLLCIRYRRRCSRWVQTSSHVRKPIPPTMISSIMTMLTSGSDMYAVNEG